MIPQRQHSAITTWWHSELCSVYRQMAECQGRTLPSLGLMTSLKRHSGIRLSPPSRSCRVKSVGWQRSGCLNSLYVPTTPHAALSCHLPLSYAPHVARMTTMYRHWMPATRVALEVNPSATCIAECSYVPLDGRNELCVSSEVASCYTSCLLSVRCASPGTWYQL